MADTSPLNVTNDDGAGDETGDADDLAVEGDAETVNHAGVPIGVQVAGSELVPVHTVTSSTGGIVTQVTQVRRPWRATLRTAFQAALALATLAPFIATGVYGHDDDLPAVVTQVLVVSAGITRVMALPQVEDFLQRFVPFLSAAPKKG